MNEVQFSFGLFEVAFEAIALLVTMVWKTKKVKDRLSQAAMMTLIDEAVKRAPPVEAKGAEEAVPFETYRKDLLRMVDGEISIDEFVEIWRGRKVEKRPKEWTALWKVLESPGFEAVLREWAFHVKAKGDGAKFGKLVRAWRDRAGPNEPERVAIWNFQAFMKTRCWEEMLAAMKPHLEPKVAECFAQENASWFYEAFRRVLVHEHQFRCVDIGVPLGKQICDCGETIDPPKDVKDSEIFGTINSVVKDMSKSLADAIDLKKVESLRPESNLMGWFDEVSSQRYEAPKAALYRCNWVRVTRPTSPAFGLLGVIRTILPDGQHIIEVRSIRNEPNLLSLEKGEFDHPPYPKEGEWWAWHRDMQSSERFVWKNENNELSYRRTIESSIVAGTLFPVNFGRGE